jgi:hypothetical protein
VSISWEWVADDVMSSERLASVLVFSRRFIGGFSGSGQEWIE